MSMKYDKLVILQFDNAGLFKKFWKNGISNNKDDRVFEGKSRNIRASEQWVAMSLNTINYEFINNVLHVLFGKRPVARYRTTCARSDDKVMSIAKRSFVKINSLIYKNKKGDELFVSEKMITRKALHNSWNHCSPSWNQMEHLLSKELYNELVDVARDICKCDPLRERLINVCDKLKNSNDSRVNNIVEKAKKQEAMSLAKLIEGGAHSLQQAGFQGLGPYLKTLVTKGVCNISRIDGLIAIPLFNSELSLFMDGDGMATIFEGGFVTINEVIDLKFTTIDLKLSDFTGAGQ